jgi:uncharacterized membrane protein
MGRTVSQSQMMSRGALKKIPLRATPFLGWGQKIHHLFFASFLAAYIIAWLRLWLVPSLFANVLWPDGLLIVLATATTLASITRRLPGQNVILAAVIIGAISGGIESVGALTGIPFGPFVYNYPAIGRELFPPLPWVIPLLWIFVLLNARGVARLILRPWRKIRAYGFYVIGLTALLVVLFDLGLEPFCARVKGFWFWGPTKLPFTWYGAPFVNFIGWGMATVLILAFATPSLIDKKKVKHPPDYQPLLLWLLLNLFLLTGVTVHQLWPAAVAIAGGTILVSIFAVRGAKW